ncbi:hypothetical protein H1R20_g6950, partial [Candolleomyces eurysporus]
MGPGRRRHLLVSGTVAILSDVERVLHSTFENDIVKIREEESKYGPLADAKADAQPSANNLSQAVNTASIAKPGPPTPRNEEATAKKARKGARLADRARATALWQEALVLPVAEDAVLGGEEDKQGTRFDGTLEDSANDAYKARKKAKREEKAAKKKAADVGFFVEKALASAEDAKAIDIEGAEIAEAAEQTAESQAGSESPLLGHFLPAITPASPTKVSLLEPTTPRLSRAPLSERLSKSKPSAPSGSAWPPVPTINATGDKSSPSVNKRDSLSSITSLWQ